MQLHILERVDVCNYNRLIRENVQICIYHSSMNMYVQYAHFLVISVSSILILLYSKAKCINLIQINRYIDSLKLEIKCIVALIYV